MPCNEFVPPGLPDNLIETDHAVLVPPPPAEEPAPRGAEQVVDETVARVAAGLKDPAQFQQTVEALPQLGQLILIALAVPPDQADVPKPRLADTHLVPAVESVIRAATSFPGDMRPSGYDPAAAGAKLAQLLTARRIHAGFLPFMEGLACHIRNLEQGLDGDVRSAMRRVASIAEFNQPLRTALRPAQDLISTPALRALSSRRANRPAEDRPAAPVTPLSEPRPAAAPTTVTMTVPAPPVETVAAPPAAAVAARRTRRARRTCR